MILSDIDPFLEGKFESFGAAHQAALEAFPWVEIPSGIPGTRCFYALPYLAAEWWRYWREDKALWTRRGFRISMPAENVWRVIFTTDAIQADNINLIPHPKNLGYFPYQEEGIRFLQGRGAALLGDEPGLGKTIQVCGLLNAEPAIRSVLIVCPASVKLTWARELAKWLCTKREVSVSGEKGFDPRADIVVINYDMLAKFQVALMRPFDLVVLDEAHYIKTPKAKRTLAAKALVSRAARKVLLTGTPILNRPAELWSLLNTLDPNSWGTFFAFGRRYCDAFHGPFGWDFTGASNLDELQQRLNEKLFLRRTKQEVLLQLPPVIRQIIPLHIDQDEVLDELSEGFEGKDVDPRKIPFEKQSAIRRLVGTLKLKAAIEWIKEETDEVDGKFLVFAHHHDVLDALGASLTRSVVVSGATSHRQRQDAVDAFQAPGGPKYFIASTQAMGVGITLTAASRVIFVEQDWTPALLEQAESRAHRIGQKDSVLVQYLVAGNSIDENIMEAVTSKMKVIKRIVEK
jgi:SNF2 family DNA or RNA helicase